MKACYHIRLSPIRIAVLDVCLVEDFFLITRINVPVEFRSQGYGTALMEKVTEDADLEEVTLALEICPYGELDYDQLQSWYERFGFEEVDGNFFKRLPQ